MQHDRLYRRKKTIHNRNNLRKYGRCSNILEYLFICALFVSFVFDWFLSDVAGLWRWVWAASAVLLAGAASAQQCYQLWLQVCREPSVVLSKFLLCLGVAGVAWRVQVWLSVFGFVVWAEGAFSGGLFFVLLVICFRGYPVCRCCF